MSLLPKLMIALILPLRQWIFPGVTVRGRQRISLGAWAIVLGTATLALPSEQSISLGASQVIAQTSASKRVEADKLFKQGEQKLNSNEPLAALEYFQQALVIYQQIKEPLAEGYTKRLIGSAYYLLKDYPQAISYQQQALMIAREIKNPDLEARALFNLGLASAGQGNTAKAIDYYQQSLAIAQEIENSELESKGLSSLAQIQNRPRKEQADQLLEQGIRQLNTGQLQAALHSEQQALMIYREILDPENEGAALGNLGGIYLSLGEYTKAIDYEKQWLAIAKQINDRQGEGKALGNLGGVYLSLGQYTDAIDYLQQWLAIAKQINDRESEGKALGNLGGVYLYLGDYGKAINYGRQHLEIARQLNDPNSEGKALGNLSLAYLSQGDYAKAIDYGQQDLAIAKRLNDRQGKGKALGNLGNAYLFQGDYAKAIDYGRQHLAIAKELGDRESEGKALGNLGNAYLLQGDYTNTIDYEKHLLVIAKQINDPESQGAALNNLGYAFYKQGNLALAERTLFEAIKVKESLRHKLDDRNKVSIFETQRNTYATLQQVLIAQKKTDTALEIAERGRARAFVELLASRSNSQVNLPVPKIQEIKQIAKQQSSTLVEYSIIYDDFKVAGKQQYNESELYIWLIKPTGEVTFRKVDLKSVLGGQNISLRDKVAQARESLVKGINVTRRSHQITLTPGDRVKLNDDDPGWEAWQVVSVDVKSGKVTIRLPSWGANQPAVERPIADVVKKIGTNIPSANAKNLQLQQLYQLLIQQIADLLPKEQTARVIFIPQDALFLVPFPALQDPSGQYLIDKHTILTAPSIEALDSTHKLRQRVPGSAKDILIVGNPTMPKVSLKLGEPPKQLEPLPGAEKEAVAIASFWKTKALIGNQATEEVVLSKLPSARIVHLATHGWFDDVRGLGSGIALAPSAKTNGLLKAEDIYNLYAPPQKSPLSAELVVLSACDTGQGRLTGDGVIGLSRSIIAAGAPSVIVSLWSIPDAPTAELMTEFYQNFQRQQDKAQALRQAMLTTKKKHPNPAEWAAFILIGESK